MSNEHINESFAANKNENSHVYSLIRTLLSWFIIFNFIRRMETFVRLIFAIFTTCVILRKAHRKRTLNTSGCVAGKNHFVFQHWPIIFIFFAFISFYFLKPPSLDFWSHILTCVTLPRCSPSSTSLIAQRNINNSRNGDSRPSSKRVSHVILFNNSDQIL